MKPRMLGEQDLWQQPLDTSNNIAFAYFWVGAVMWWQAIRWPLLMGPTDTTQCEVHPQVKVVHRWLSFPPWRKVQLTWHGTQSSKLVLRFPHPTHHLYCGIPENHTHIEIAWLHAHVQVSSQHPCRRKLNTNHSRRVQWISLCLCLKTQPITVMSAITGTCWNQSCNHRKLNRSATTLITRLVAHRPPKVIA